MTELATAARNTTTLRWLRPSGARWRRVCAATPPRAAIRARFAIVCVDRAQTAALLAIFVSSLPPRASLELVPAREARRPRALVVRRRGRAGGHGGLQAGGVLSHGDTAESWWASGGGGPGPRQVRVTAGAVSLDAPLESSRPSSRAQAHGGEQFERSPASAKARIKADQAAFQKAWATSFQARAFTDNFQKPREAGSPPTSATRER